MTDIEAVDDVTCEVLDLIEVLTADGTTFVQHEDHVNTEALGAALFQLVARLNEIVHVASGAVVRRPEGGLTLDVTWDAVIFIARLKQVLYIDRFITQQFIVVLHAVCLCCCIKRY